jgi:hypothetical protein
MMIDPVQAEAHGSNLNVVHETTACRPNGILFIRLTAVIGIELCHSRKE